MEIIKAERLGFCFGVKNAVEMARKTVTGGQTPDRGGHADENSFIAERFIEEGVNGSGHGSTVERSIKEGGFMGDADVRPVYVVGPVIHNAQVMRELIGLGLKMVPDLDAVPYGATLIVRSHGAGADFFRRTEEKALAVVDATCPKVRHIQQLVNSATRSGYQVIIAGDPSHPEVLGLVGWCGGGAQVVSSREEALDAVKTASTEGTRLFVVSQTTFEQERFREIASVFEKRCGDSETVIKNTICAATKERQTACETLAGQVDAMLIIGDKSSSNTKKLYEISKKFCPKTYFVENTSDIPLKDIADCNKIGITAGASTPESSIKEVITAMSEIKNDSNELNPMHEFMDEIDKALRLPRNGDIITGEVIQVTDKDVIVNIGCKKDGVIPRNEVTLESDQSLTDVFKEGDEVQAKVLKNDDGDGNILLSKKRVIISEHWEDITKALEEKTALEVTVLKEVNGGVIAAFNEINGFIPMSQLSDRYVEKADEFVGKTLPVKIMRVDQKRNKVVFSHKSVLNEERQKRMMEVWDTINVGDDIVGKVMRFTEYGAFVDIGGIDGLLHISEISWGKLRHPEEVLKIDQEIKVKVLSMNKDKEKISLGYKQNLPEPWSIINEKYSVGQVIKGRAVQLKDYGVFVELEPGLDGLVHISEIAYKRVNNISDEIEVGQEITAKILEIDKDRRRISLSIKETLDRPVEEMPAEGADQESGEEDAPINLAALSSGDAPTTTLGDKMKEALAAAAERTEELASAAKEKVEDIAESVADKAEDIVEAVTDKAEDIVETVADKAGDIVEAVADKAGDFAEAVADKASDIVETVKEKVSDIVETGAAETDSAPDQPETETETPEESEIASEDTVIEEDKDGSAETEENTEQAQPEALAEEAGDVAEPVVDGEATDTTDTGEAEAEEK